MMCRSRLARVSPQPAVSLRHREAAPTCPLLTGGVGRAASCDRPASPGSVLRGADALLAVPVQPPRPPQILLSGTFSFKAALQTLTCCYSLEATEQDLRSLFPDPSLWLGRGILVLGALRAPAAWGLDWGWGGQSGGAALSQAE